jgi:uncharacterized protein
MARTIDSHITAGRHADVSEVWKALLDRLRRHDALIIAFSGGVDSTLLADAAYAALGRRARMITAVSPSLPQRELDLAVDLATARGWDHRLVETTEMERPEYVVNGPDRCYHCRVAFLEALAPLRRAAGDATIAMGMVLDDLDDTRPGIGAAREAGVVMPLVDCGLTKAVVRDVAQWRGLEVWDKPASACLASRIPFGTPVTVEALDRIERAEQALHDLGFEECRVRDHDRCARIEVPRHRFGDLLRLGDEVIAAFRPLGYVWVSLDMAGLRSGSMNAVFPEAGSP